MLYAKTINNIKTEETEEKMSKIGIDCGPSGGRTHDIRIPLND